MNKRYLIEIPVILMLMTCCPAMGSGVALSSSVAAHSVCRHLEYGFTLWNTTDRVVRDAELWVCVPILETPTQKRTGLTASHAYEITVDGQGNQMLHFTFSRLAPFDAKIINIAVDLECSGTACPVISEDAASYISEETYCESDDREIVKLAGRLRSNSVSETARNIYEWVSGNLNYSGYSKGIKGARHALDTKRGDCTEFMYLFMALCRANRIPARGIGGFVCDKDSLLGPEGYHNWAEFYDGAAWQLSDPQKRNFMDKNETYIAMRYVSPSEEGPIGITNLFGFAGDGINARMN